MGMPEDIVGRGTEVRTEADEMELAIQQLCDKIKELATGGIEATDTSKKYARKFTFEGDSYKVIYIPKKDKTDDSDETKEEFIVTKKSSLFLTQPDASTKQVSYGYTLNFVKDSKKGKEKPEVHVHSFPNNFHDIVVKNRSDFRYAPMDDMHFYLLAQTENSDYDFIPLGGGYKLVQDKLKNHASIKMIGDMVEVLSKINPLPA